MPWRSFLGLLLVACTPPPRMCVAPGECTENGSCVAGRCVARGATAAIDNGRRLLFAPIDAAYVRPGGGGASRSIATFGRAGDEGAVVLLRFAARLAPEAELLEAYLLLERMTDVDADPSAILLHALPVVQPWDGGSVSWARAPRVEEVGAPVTRVSPSSGPYVRLDVRAIVERWRRRGRGDYGVAIVAAAEGKSATGVPFALAPWDEAPDRRDLALAPTSQPPPEPPSPFDPRPVTPASVGEPRAELVGPLLELYVR